MSKKENKIKGNLGEDLATKFLTDKGFTILDRNFNCAYGEIDIIGKDNDEIVFCEVKTRFQGSYGNPAEAVDSYKKYHIYNSAKYYLYKCGFLELPIRFDVVEVKIYKDKTFKISHYKNVILDEPNKNSRRRK